MSECTPPGCLIRLLTRGERHLATTDDLAELDNASLECTPPGCLNRAEETVELECTPPGCLNGSEWFVDIIFPPPAFFIVSFAVIMFIFLYHAIVSECCGA